MSNETERPIEKHLRAVAQKRREEAGNSFDLHPATRRLLHDEVARKYAKHASKPRFLGGFGVTLWPRFALGLGSLIVLGLGAWFFVASQHQEKPNTLLAKNDTQRDAREVQAPARPQAELAPSGQVSEELAKLDSIEKASAAPRRDEPLQLSAERAKEADHSTVASEQLPKQAMEMRAPLASAAPAKDQADSAALSRQIATPKAPGEESFAMRYGLASSSSSPAPTAGGRSSVLPPETQADRGQAMLSLGDNVSQQETAAQLVTARAFSGALVGPASTSAVLRTYFTSVGNSLQGAYTDKLAEQEAKMKSAPIDKASSLKAILPSFAVEQQGAALRVIDRDGSIYSGYLQPAPMPVVAAKTTDTEIHKEVALAQTFRKRMEPQASPTPANFQAAQQNYFFNVSGTNRSLNRSVIFSGNLLTQTNSLGLPSSANPVDSNVPSSPQNVENVPQPFLRISGKAVVGQKDELQIEAVPAQRQGGR